MTGISNYEIISILDNRIAIRLITNSGPLILYEASLFHYLRFFTF